MKTKLLFALSFLGLAVLALVVAESRETSRSEVTGRLGAAAPAATSSEDADRSAERTPPAVEIVSPPETAEPPVLAAAVAEPAIRSEPRTERAPRRAEREAEPAAAAAATFPSFTELVLEGDLPAEEAVVASLPGSLPAEPEIDPSPARVTYRRDPVVFPAGTVLSVELLEPLSSETSHPGDPVRARTLEPLFADGRLAVPAGSRVLGQVTEVRKVKKIGGKALLALDFDRLSVPSTGTWPLAAALVLEGKSETGRDAAAIGGGAAAGAILGRAIKDRKKGKGALLGAILGAAAGAAIAAETDGEPVDLPAGARLDLVLERDLETAIEVQVIES